MEDPESIVFRTHFTNMMPQRGYLNSAQPLVPVLDIDLACENHYILKMFREEDVTYFFVENGPMKIHPLQPSFVIEAKDAASLDALSRRKFYLVVESSVKSSDDRVSFLDYEFKCEEVEFDVDLSNGRLVYVNTPRVSEILAKSKYLVFSHPGEMNVAYDPKLHIDHSESVKKYHEEGLEAVLSRMDEVFKELNASGHLYKTRNGLRVILTDQLRDLRKTYDRDFAIGVMDWFMVDEQLKEMYLRRDRPLINYLARLTPKLKNYKYFSDKYENVLMNLHSVNLETLRLEKNIKPLSYDFDKVKCEGGKEDEFLNKSFGMLKNMIFEYLNQNSYAVCTLLKSYHYAGEDKLAAKFCTSHDKWTKAKNHRATLI